MGTEQSRPYSEEYRHFDNLIWQIPVWASAITALCFQVASGNLAKLAFLLGVKENNLVAAVAGAGSLCISMFGYVMHRFRWNQADIPDRKNYYPKFWGGTMAAQFLVYLQSAGLIWVACRAAGFGIVVEIGALAILFFWVVALFIQLQSHRKKRARFYLDQAPPT